MDVPALPGSCFVLTAVLTALGSVKDLCKKSLRLDFNWCRFRRNWLGLFCDDRLRAGGWLVSFADDHQDEREQDCDTEDSAQNADGDFLGFKRPCHSASGGVGTSEKTSSGGRASSP